jgi:hypothetical protein
MKKLFLCLAVFATLNAKADITIKGVYKKVNDGTSDCVGTKGTCVTVHSASASGVSKVSVYNDAETVVSSFNAKNFEVTPGSNKTTITYTIVE